MNNSANLESVHISDSANPESVHMSDSVNHESVHINDSVSPEHVHINNSVNPESVHMNNSANPESVHIPESFPVNNSVHAESVKIYDSEVLNQLRGLAPAVMCRSQCGVVCFSVCAVALGAGPHRPGGGLSAVGSSAPRGRGRDGFRERETEVWLQRGEGLLQRLVKNRL